MPARVVCGWLLVCCPPLLVCPPPGPQFRVFSCRNLWKCVLRQLTSQVGPTLAWGE